MNSKITIITITTFIIILTLISFSSSQKTLQKIKLEENTKGSRFFVDEFGRVRLFHGTNFVEKVFPWYPSLNRSEIASLKDLGFNAVRLGCMWAGIEPSR